MNTIVMGLVLVLGPVAGYFLGDSSKQGLLIGLGLAAIVLFVYLVVDRIPLDALVFGMIGAAGGLIMVRVIDWLILKTDHAGAYNFLQDNFTLINLFIAVLGAMIAIRKKNELDLLDKNIIVRGNQNQDIVVLDTSVLIDGRIADVAETGFLGGKLLVPRFVLHELQQVADSADGTKRQRGRRGLDMLKRLQDADSIHLKIYDKDYAHIKEVDTKVMELAKELGCKVATTDLNMNKVAVLQGIPILNINDLALVLKTVVLPGDSLTIYLAKEGKERQQAIGYLDDGTMVVAEEGRRLMGKRVNVHVNSVLQTSAGRMIFSRVLDGRDLSNDAAMDADSRPSTA